MAYLIALDDGHGANTPGKRTPVIPELGRSIRENEFNRAVVKYLDAELKRCGFRTLLVAPTDADTSLRARTNLANSKGADLYVSCHYNAGGGEGIETYHYPGSSKGARAARLIHKYVVQGTKQKNRGVKTANFHVLRETKMPAVLIEYGFMDDPGLEEAKRMIDPAFQKECAVETAKGVCEYFGVKYVPGGSSPAGNHTAPANSSPPYPGHLLKRGSRGEDVKVIQRRLEVTPDGIFGPITEQAVKNWQRVHDGQGRVCRPGYGLEIDGIVGPRTWAALF